MSVKNSGLRRWALWLSVLLAVAAAAAWTVMPQPVPVATARVTRGPLTSTVTGEGWTRVKELFVIAAPVDGRLDRIALQPGDSIRLDDVVANIAPAASRPLDARSRAEATAAAAAARAVLARAGAAEQEARVQLAHAESKVETTRGLVQTGAAPSDTLTHLGHEAEMSRRALDSATAAVGAARADLARAQAVLGTANDPGQLIPVRSPVTGRILRVLRDSAGPVATGAPLLEAGDVTHLEVQADLLSSDAALVHEGASANVTGWGGKEVIAARVRRIDPAAFTKVSALGLEEQRVHVVLDLVQPPPHGLGHDYRVDVAIATWEGQGVLRVPATALFRAGQRWAVFRVVNSRADRAFVELGPSDGTWTAIIRGLREGEEVITQPADTIETGTRLNAVHDERD